MPRHETRKTETRLDAAVNQLLLSYESAENIKQNAQEINPELERYFSRHLASGDTSVVNSISTYLENVKLNQALQENTSTDNATMLETEIEDIIEAGDTYTLLERLGGIDEILKTNRKSAIKAITDGLILEGSLDGANIDAADELMNTRLAHIKNPLVKPTEPTQTWPNTRKSTRKSRKEEKAVKQFRDKEALRKAELNNLATINAISQGKYDTQVQKTERSIALYDITATSAPRFGKIIEKLSSPYLERLELLGALEIEAVTMNSQWMLGEANSTPDLPAYTATVLDEWAEQLADMSPYDSERAESMKEWVIQSVRLHQRRILAADPTDTGLVRFTADRGVAVQTPDDVQLLYEDGSIGIQEVTGWKRYNTNGTEWVPLQDTEHSEVDASYHKQLRKSDTNELWELSTDSFNAWETERTDEAETIAAVTTAAFADSLAKLTEQHATYFNELDIKFNESDDIFNSVVAGRDAEISNLLSAMESPTDADKTTATNTVDAHIAELKTARDDTVARRDAALEGVRKSQESTNKTEYWRGFFAVTKPEEAHKDKRGEAEMLTDGVVMWRNTVLNGIQGDWAIRKDGEAVITKSDGTTTHYLANGEVA